VTPKTWGESKPSPLQIVRTLMPLARTAPGPTSPFTGSANQGKLALSGELSPTTANHDFKQQIENAERRVRVY
jgi:hypothetical protein